MLRAVNLLEKLKIKPNAQMLDGIDYYPKKSKKKSQSKVWIVVVLVLFVGGYLTSQFFDKQAVKSSGQTMIIISKAKKSIEEPTSIIIKSNKAYQPSIDHRVKSGKGLDELIQIFKQQ
jgi:aspartate ammonia-lyase